MKAKTIIILGLLLLLISCEKEPAPIVINYDGIHYVRTGGGATDFRLTRTSDSNIISVSVTLYNYIEVLYYFTIARNSNNTELFDAFYKAVEGNTTITGDYKPTDACTGTWINIYFTKDTTEEETTNTELRTTLIQFETIITDEMNQINS